MGWGWIMKGEQLAPIHFGDGPPWSEDEDLQSPVVGYFAGTSGDNSESITSMKENEPDGPGGEYVTYPSELARRSMLAPYNVPGQRDSHFAGLLPRRSYTDESGQDYRSESDASSTVSSPGMTRHDESRYSRDYQFTIASPDEEMHGTAVALRSKTRESGLVPEEYVRLLRDIQGGLNSLTGQAKHSGTTQVQAMAAMDINILYNPPFQHPPKIYTYTLNIFWVHRLVKLHLRLYIIMGNGW
ncbi:hypothetical protein DID88_008727 [Monilinia fructigena]|uniref:Uncharacterized protein n=1 Tax=Monilinia fructigena TaxID=38457 RepID=A0A395J8M8_9HELO|nr:hypothetical protein DID88_008727 [Monilinia fructigena]